MLSLPTVLTTTWLKADLQHLLSPSTSPRYYQEKIHKTHQWHKLSIKKLSLYQEKNHKAHQWHKTQLEETEPVTEPDTGGMLELSDWEFKTTMINMLRALIDKVDSM